MNAGVTLLTAAGVFFGASLGRAEDWTSRAHAVAESRLRAARLHPRSSVTTSSFQQTAGDTVYTLAGGVHADAGESADPGIRLALAQKPETPDADQPTASAPATRPREIERGPLPTLNETITRDVHDMWGDLWRDTKAVYLNPWNVVFLVGAGGASLAVRPEVDDDIEDYYDDHHTFGKGFRDFLDAAGSPATGFIVAGTWYLAGQVLQQDKTYEVGKRLASALIITDLSTVLLKAAAYTEAPNDIRFAWPSGHVSSTMALATVLNDAYGPLVGAPMYALTAFVGWQRLDSREHHFSDVLFGAALGWVVAEQVMKEHRPEIFGGEIVPYVSAADGTAGIGWLKTLGND